MEFSFDQRQKLAAAICRIPEMADVTTRRGVIASLPEPIASSIGSFPSCIVEIFAALKVCLDHRHGVAHLVLAIDLFAGDSDAVLEVRRIAAEYGLLDEIA
jgi:hypothetical protein